MVPESPSKGRCPWAIASPQRARCADAPAQQAKKGRCPWATRSPPQAHADAAPPEAKGALRGLLEHGGRSASMSEPAAEPAAQADVVATAQEPKADDDMFRPLEDGVLKSFNAERGFGFITGACLDSDIFVLRSELPCGDDCFEPGRPLRFMLTYNRRGQPQAKSVTWRTAERFKGCLKSLGEEYGFIDCPAARELFNRDVYIARIQLPKEVIDEPSEMISFRIALNSGGHPQAKDVVLELAEDVAADHCGELRPQPAERRVRW